MGSKDLRNFSYAVLAIFALTSVILFIGLDEPVARGQALLGLLVSLSGILILIANH